MDAHGDSEGVLIRGRVAVFEMSKRKLQIFNLFLFELDLQMSHRVIPVPP